MFMKQVSIPLEPKVAFAYSKASPELQEKARYLVNHWLKDIFSTKKRARKELFEIMDITGKIAAERGLTPEILEELLKDES